MAALFTGRPTSAAAQAVLTFWFEDTKPYQWFRRSEQFDQTVCTKFDAMHEAACSSKLDVWKSNPHHCLALIIILDQFSRNIYRDTPRAFAQDEQALAIANDAICRRYDQLFDRKEKAFFYMPFMHSEDLSVQEKSVALYKAQLPGTMNVPYAIEHRDIVKKFGRFPHRNKIMGRQSTPAETAFLKAGGFNP